MQKKSKKLSFVRGINPLPLLSECVPAIQRRPLRDGFKQFEIAETEKVRGGGGTGSGPPSSWPTRPLAVPIGPY
jgi:hypothetical protein